MKKYVTVCICVLLAAVLVWYHIPIERVETVDVYCDDPNAPSLRVEFDLKLSRSLFAPLKVNGTIHIEGREYVVWGRQKYGLIRNIQRKAKGELDLPIFVNAANFGRDTSLLISDLLYIHSLRFGKNYTISYVWLSMNADDHGAYQNCPAEP